MAIHVCRRSIISMAVSTSKHSGARPLLFQQVPWLISRSLACPSTLEHRALLLLDVHHKSRLFFLFQTEGFALWKLRLLTRFFVWFIQILPFCFYYYWAVGLMFSLLSSLSEVETMTAGMWT